MHPLPRGHVLCVFQRQPEGPARLHEQKSRRPVATAAHHSRHPRPFRALRRRRPHLRDLQLRRSAPHRVQARPEWLHRGQRARHHPARQRDGGGTPFLQDRRQVLHRQRRLCAHRPHAVRPRRPRRGPLRDGYDQCPRDDGHPARLVVQQRRPARPDPRLWREVRHPQTGRQRVWRRAAPPGRHRRSAQWRLVGLFDDGFQVRRPDHVSLSRHLAGRLAILRTAGQPRPLAAHLGKACGRRTGCADGHLPAQR